MNYSEEFKQKVLAILGDNEELRQRLDAGEEVIGSYLYNHISERFTPEEIIIACESQNFQDVYQKAKRQLAIKQLYNEWLENYRQPINQGMHR